LKTPRRRHSHWTPHRLQKIATTTASSILPLLDGKGADERAAVKGEEIAKIGSVPRTKVGDYDIKITSMEPIDGGVQV
jgi:hypothetical protein